VALAEVLHRGKDRVELVQVGDGRAQLTSDALLLGQIRGKPSRASPARSEQAIVEDRPDVAGNGTTFLKLVWTNSDLLRFVMTIVPGFEPRGHARRNLYANV